jgi:glycosyltransferase involved in cell wall biosynthesis
VHTWHIIASEYPPDIGGVSDYTRLVAHALAQAGDAVHVWCPGPERALEAGVEVHPELDRIRPIDLRRLDTRLDVYPAPRRLLVQWVPHGFGYHSMNVWFCLWLARRARWGDHVELMVHEPYLAFEPGPLRHTVMALVHRVMTMILLGASRRVWVSIPAWVGRLRPYALGRGVAMTWLPIPAALPGVGGGGPETRGAFVDGDRPLVGHFGTFGPAVSALLDARVPAILAAREQPSLLLIGAGSDRFCQGLLARRPDWTGRVHAAGCVPPSTLSALVGACDVLVQPYPDGVSTRRTTAMACLAHGRPVVTTRGHLTEPLWDETGAACLVDVADVEGFGAQVRRLLGDVGARQALGARGGRVYDERFAVRHVVAALRAA